MPSISPRLGLVRPLSSDAFITQDFYDNYTTLDSYPGSYICTSSTRPSGWGSAQTGMEIFETDTLLRWYWSGTAFIRHAAEGVLGHSDLTSDFATTATSSTSTSPSATAISCTVSVPATHSSSTTKRIRVTASYYRIDNTAGVAEATLYSGTTLLYRASIRGKDDGEVDPMDWAGGGSIVAFDLPSTSGGSVTYTLRVNSLAASTGTTTLRASATAPAVLVVEEVGV